MEPKLFEKGQKLFEKGQKFFEKGQKLPQEIKKKFDLIFDVD